MVQLYSVHELFLWGGIAQLAEVSVCVSSYNTFIQKHACKINTVLIILTGPFPEKLNAPFEYKVAGGPKLNLSCNINGTLN